MSRMRIPRVRDIVRRYFEALPRIDNAKIGGGRRPCMNPEQFRETVRRDRREVQTVIVGTSN